MKCVLLRFGSNSSLVSHDYLINNTSIQALNCHRDLGIMISSDLNWSDHLKFIASRAYKALGLIRRSFSTSLDVKSKKNLYLSLIRSQLTYGSVIWRPHLIRDIIILERIQRRATKYILNDYQSDYKHRLQSLKLLPLVMQLEFYDVMFFIRSLKNPSNTFSIQSFVHFSDANTRSSFHLKLKHSYSKSNTSRHFYFNRLPRLWNSLPPVNPKLSFHTIRKKVLKVFWSRFSSHFVNSDPCSFHYCCPCAKCVSSSVVTNYSLDH